MLGRINSFQSFGTLDGPGLRCVVFMQGCPLRCSCCHNPETWDTNGGEEWTAADLAARIRRYRRYIEGGGVTVSGGEPLLQAQFVAELFELCHNDGFHTCLDTSGCLMNSDVMRLLDLSDLVILDYKMPDAERYLRYTRCDIARVDAFLEELQRRQKPTWLRQVHIPGLNSEEKDIERFFAKAREFSCVEKAELLHFRKLCTEKYEALGIPFPLADTPESVGELPPIYIRQHIS